MSVDGARFWTIFGLGLALLGIYGPVVGIPDHDGFRYLLLPLLCSWVPALYYKLRPIQPYSGYRGRWGDLGPMIGKDEKDAEAKSLVDLLRSGEGQAAVTRVAIRSSMVLFVPMALISLALWGSLTWTLLVALALLRPKPERHRLLDCRFHPNYQLGRKDLGSDHR